jgi:Mn2+/Fe2+ NRAMP family transporter
MAEKIDPGKMPDWGRADLPAPPPFNFKNALAVIGPGTIALSMAIGSGEWLMGPSATVRFGPEILWVTTVAVFFQVIFNQECARYVMYTGETIFGGFMRTAPGPRTWGWTYFILGALHVGWPGWAAASAAALVTALAGHIPGAADKGAMLAWGYVSFAAAVAVLLFGGTVERGLEKISTFIVLWIFFFLVAFNLIFVPFEMWVRVFKGLFAFGMVPQGADWLLLGAFAAYSGTGGIGNLFTASWLRDKGFGMGGVVGAIPSAVGSKSVSLSKLGITFDPDKEANMRNWKAWWKYLQVDQAVVWGGGCMLGMYLCVLIAVGIIPAGKSITGLAAGAYQAEYMAKLWNPLWFLSLFTGFWILWGTQLSITDGYVRTITDVIWSSTEKPHKWKAGPKLIYYISLLIFSLWGCIAINLAAPMMLLMIGANMAGFIFVVACPHIIYVNNRFLPKALRPPMWRNIVMALMCIFYGFFVFALVGQQTGWWKFSFKLEIG